MGRSKMIDEALIAAIAKRLGWTEDGHGGYGHISGYYWHGKVLPSVDAALGILDKKVRFSIDWFRLEDRWMVCYRTAIKHNESLPRAILLAFLEVPEEKP